MTCVITASGGQGAGHVVNCIQHMPRINVHYFKLEVILNVKVITKFMSLNERNTNKRQEPLPYCIKVYKK
jgi:hypothetical protein